MKAPISLCIINRNDAANLVRLVARARPYVEEIVVVDTGSDDGSPQAARAVGADIVIERPDLLTDGNLRSFSEARQVSFDAASQPWLLWLDTDDDLLGWELLSHLCKLADLQRDISGPGFHVRMFYDYSWNADRSQCTQSFTRERLVHRDDGWKWRRPVHEFLRRDQGFEPEVRVDTIRVIHLSQGARGIANNRNLRILFQWLADGGSEEDPQALFYYLGDEMLARGEFQKAFNFFVQVPDGRPYWWDRSRFRAARALVCAGRYADAIDFLAAAIKHKPTVADFRWEMARALLITGERGLALDAYESSRGCEPIEGESPELPLAVAHALGVAA